MCSPGGTTIAGVEALEKSSFRAAAMSAVAAASARHVRKNSEDISFKVRAPAACASTCHHGGYYRGGGGHSSGGGSRACENRGCQERRMRCYVE